MGGVGGDSGEVQLIAKGDIETFEDGSQIVAQSVGGGGGTGAINVSGGVGISRGERAPLALRPSVLVEWVVAQEMHKA